VPEWKFTVPFPTSNLATTWKVGGGGFVQSVYGPYLQDTPGDRTFELCTTGYGSFISDAISNHDREFLFLDIGANCGVFSLLAATHPLCRMVIAVEPVPQTFESLKANIAFNRADKIRGVRAAISDEGGREVRLTYNPRHSGMSSVTRKSSGNTIAAPVLDADGLAALVGGSSCSIFAKIDVEGSEAGVLAVLSRCSFFGAITDIVIEISERNCGKAGVRGVIERMEREGFAELDRNGAPEHYDAHYRRLHSAGQPG
jgi:FkbM family methyltransferase